MKGKKQKMPKARGQWRRLEVNSMEEQQQKKQAKKLVITIDSGAAESVINEEHAPMIQTTPSQGSRSGVEYVNANGATMPNRGEKYIPIKTENGSECTVRMQVTDVKRTLLSVGRVCDTGHEVIFHKNGGFIRDVKTGKTFDFKRVAGVYRMEVDIDEAQVFSGPE